VGSGHAAGTYSMRNAYKILALIPETVSLIGIQNTREDNTKIEKK
jgi:hypothetical protein